MPDSLGRYFLSELQDRVKRLLDSLQLVVQPSGQETSATMNDQSYSNTDITNQINESLTRLYGTIITGKESIFAVTEYLSTTANNPGPYQFPPNMIQLRWMKWKDPNIPFNPTPSPNFTPQPVDWYPMVQVDNPADWTSEEAYRAPTWRWEAGMFTLNSVIFQANTNGIQCNFVAIPKELVNPTDIINVPMFTRYVQQVVIYDAAYTLAFSKHKQVTEEISSKRKEWYDLLTVLVENAYNKQSVQMTAPRRMIRGSYTGRFRRILNYRNNGF